MKKREALEWIAQNATSQIAICRFKKFYERPGKVNLVTTEIILAKTGGTQICEYRISAWDRN
jgi:hypothetical protein